MDPGRADGDFDAEIDPALANGVAEPLERERGVLLGVAGDDVAAAAANQFVEPQVLEVAAV
jgi:hypothetical protein